jgi:hypothetical protein
MALDLAQSKIEFNAIVLDGHAIRPFELDEVLKGRKGTFTFVFLVQFVKSYGYFFNTIISF